MMIITILSQVHWDVIISQYQYHIIVLPSPEHLLQQIVWKWECWCTFVRNEQLCVGLLSVNVSVNAGTDYSKRCTLRGQTDSPTRGTQHQAFYTIDVWVKLSIKPCSNLKLLEIPVTIWCFMFLSPHTATCR